MSKELQIRDAIAAALIAAATPAGNRVFPMRWEPGDESQEIPAICIYTIDSPSENEPNDNAERRACNVDVVLYETGPRQPATAPESADFKLDTLRDAVETRLNVLYDMLGVQGVIKKTYGGFRIKSNLDKEPNAERLNLAAILRYTFDYIYDNQGLA